MKCKYCFGKVDPKASKCEHCGEWLSYRLSLKKKELIYVPIFLILYLAVTSFARWQVDKISEKKKMHQYKKESFELNIQELNEIKTKNDIYLVAKIKNTSNFTYHSIRVVAEFFDREQKIVDIRDTFIGSLAAGEEKSFKIRQNCDVESQNNQDGNSLYEVKIDSAYRYGDGT